MKDISAKALTDDSTLLELRAKLKPKVQQAIASHRSKNKAPLPAANPLVEKVHDDPDSHLVAMLIKDFFEHHKLKNSLSVYNPEIALDGRQVPSKSVLAIKTGLGNQYHG